VKTPAVPVELPDSRWFSKTNIEAGAVKLPVPDAELKFNASEQLVPIV
jgi:hypothetical protein